MVTKSANGFPGLTILLTQEGSVLTKTITGRDGGFSFANVPAGTYTLVVEGIGYPAKKTPVGLVAGQSVPLLIPFPGPCRYGYPPQQLPTCVEGHTNGLIPIVYGLPKQRAMRRAKAGKLYLGGCDVTGCDPKYYCPIHKKKL